MSHNWSEAGIECRSAQIAGKGHVVHRLVDLRPTVDQPIAGRRVSGLQLQVQVFSSSAVSLVRQR